MTLQQQLKNGGALRYRQGVGFYIVRQGQQINVNQAEAEAALRANQLRNEGGGPDKFGVYHFSMKAKT